VWMNNEQHEQKIPSESKVDKIKRL